MKDYAWNDRTEGAFGKLPDVSKINAEFLHGSFYKITQAEARRLSPDGKLPRDGYCKRVVFDGKRCELHWLIEDGKEIIALMVTSQLA